MTRLIRRGHSFSGRERNAAFLNLGQGRFANVSAASGLDLIDDARALAPVDWDHDGDLDLWQMARTGPRLRLLRNDAATGERSVTLLLVGRDCNRDAVGACVELETAGPSPRRLLRCVRAGDGFLCQGTRRLGFGLRPGETIAAARVRWPGQREPERVSGLAPGGAFRVTQGTGQGEPLPPRTDVRLTEGGVAPPASTAEARVVLALRPPAPLAEFPSLTGERKPWETAFAGPVWLGLWSRHCPPCRAELQEFAAAAQEFAAAGVTVAALHLDGDPDDAAAPAELRPLLDAAGFQGVSGAASQEDGAALLRWQHETFPHRERPLVAPSSFLIDRQRRVAVFYRGRVAPRQALADAQLLDRDAAVLEAAAFPFPGRGASALFPDTPLSRAAAYFEGGYHADAAAELRPWLAQPDPTNAADRGEGWWLLAQAEQAAGHASAATAAARRVLEIAAAAPRTRLAAALRLADADRTAALTELERLTAASRSNPALLRRVAAGCLQLGEAPRAADLLDRAVVAFPQDADLIVQQAITLESLARAKDAAARYRAALELAPRHPQANNNLAWLLVQQPAATAAELDEALRLARRAAEQTGRQDARILATLAAAEGASGNHERAAQTLREAAAAAFCRGQLALAEELRRRTASKP